VKKIIVTPDVLETSRLRKEFAVATSSGAVVCFEGIVRDHHHGRAVEAILYECFVPMARLELQRVADEACQKWPIGEYLLAHRTGTLRVGEVSLVVMVQSAHRREAFAAIQYIIDELKRRVPVWKKERYADGQEEWVGCEHCH
jgi:molybdopterin synthase catalytic subunit